MGVIVAAFMVAFRYSRIVAAKTVLEHAASRAARAKAVGFNRFMCEKTARAAAIPVSGRRLWPEGDIYDEVSKIPIYLESENASRAHGVLEYELWHKLKTVVTSNLGLSPEASAKITLEDDGRRLSGDAKIESHYPLYMFDGGE